MAARHTEFITYSLVSALSEVLLVFPLLLLELEELELFELVSVCCFSLPVEILISMVVPLVAMPLDD